MQQSNQSEGNRYLYGVADEKFVKEVPKKSKKTSLFSFKFALGPPLQERTDNKIFKRYELPIVFKCKPDTLVNLCLKVLDALSLPKVYEWSIGDICKWLRQKNFKQYQKTFRANLITGRNLLLLDASALAAMNIRDFDHIKKLSEEIRFLFFYEMTKFGRCLSLYPEFHMELYKLVRLKTGAKYHIRSSDVWRKMQMIRQKEPNHSHWEILEQWLDFDQDLQSKELIGSERRNNIYTYKHLPQKQPIVEKSHQCTCIPPCECFSDHLNYRRPWNLKCLPSSKPDLEFVQNCSVCCPICNCRWSAKNYQIHGVFSCLKKSFPNKYDGNFGLMRQRKSDQITFTFFPQI